MANEPFWLYDWIDNLGITNYSQALKLLQDRAALDDLRQRAGAVSFTTERLNAGDEFTIVAGRAIDLSGSLDCLAWECVQKQVDILFNRVWLYFDRIVIVGPSAHTISAEFEMDSGLPRHLSTYVRLLLYLREIGAEELVRFRQKRPACELHLKDHLKEVGIEDLEAQAESLILPLAKESEIRANSHDDHIHYSFVHREFEHTVWGETRPESNEDVTHAVARAVVRKYLAGLASDLYTARTLNCALGSTIGFHGRLLGRELTPRNEDVAFQLQLPVIEGLDARTLLQIRNEETLSFARFRRALSTAINERTAAARKIDVEKIANGIRKDVLEPALADIESRLKGTTRSFRKKTGATLVIASVPMMYGLYTMNPLLIAAGLTPAVSSLNNAAHRYIEERGNVRLSDMFFLWHAQKHASRHAA